MIHHGQTKPLNRILILGCDQLNRKLPESFDPQYDAVYLNEADYEIAGPQVHKQRILMYLASMRHLKADLEKDGIRLIYHPLSQPVQIKSQKTETDLIHNVINLHPKKLACIRPGSYEALDNLQKLAHKMKLPLEIFEDSNFFITPSDFAGWATDKKRQPQEFFYRWMRKKFGVLMDNPDTPTGLVWNFDPQNRKSLPHSALKQIHPPVQLSETPIVQEVKHLINLHFKNNPGSVNNFNVPVTPEQANRWLDDFVNNRLTHFGAYEDAMWSGQPLLYHSRLSSPLNLKLLDPRIVVRMASKAFTDGLAPINSVEGFVRQVIGWREFIHGLYWKFMPEYENLNYFDCEDQDIPHFFWNGETDMNCLKQSMDILLQTGYVHHIHRLMVFGNFSLTAGIHPIRFHQWHKAMYCDATDWASLPNSLGMSQFGDGGRVASKPYCSTGLYINKMSNFCKDCRYNPRKSNGNSACPFTVLYFDFLMRNRKKLTSIARLRPQFHNLELKGETERAAIARQADMYKGMIAQNKLL